MPDKSITIKIIGDNSFVMMNKSRKLLELINLINETELYRKLNIPNWLVTFVYSFAISVQVILCIAFGIHNDFDLYKCIWHFSVGIAIFQMTISYFFILSNKSLLINTLSTLQRTVTRSMYEQIYFFLLSFKFNENIYFK